jgi:hypothetical protein
MVYHLILPVRPDACGCLKLTRFIVRSNMQSYLRRLTHKWSINLRLNKQR